MQSNKTGFALGLAIGLALIISGTSPALAFQIGDLKVGGAIRANYVIGDYESDGSDNPQRGDNGGNFELDTFRINLDYKRSKFLGKVEYRFYDGVRFLHTGWLGYQFDDDSQLQVGVNRVPFGVGPYGPSNNFFFDQHYYVGLSDDMDLGAKYSTKLGSLKLDLAYYFGPEPNGVGAGNESDRYSYDIVDEDSPYSYYKEEHQFNARAIYPILGNSLPTDIGISLQYGLLDADERYADDSAAYAGSIHTKSTMGNWTLMLQLTHYNYDADYKTGATNGNGLQLSNDLIAMGAWEFTWPVASQGTIPAVALSYMWKPNIDFIDSITFYNDYSIILKDGQDAAGRDLQDSAMNVTGMAIASGGWYIYVDYVLSDGNFFVGNTGDSYGATYEESTINDFGANALNDWRYRFNINFGYYF